MNMKFISRLAAVIFAGLMSLSAFAAGEVWSETPAGLPYCRYDDSDSDLRFLLGNYRMNLITHSNGIYQIISGERVWARYNADPAKADHGRSRAALTLGRKVYNLAGQGMNVADEKYDVYSGIGFTRYDYKLRGGLRCSRMISVMPSDEVNGGLPCFVITVTITNSGLGSKTINYEEVFSPEFLPIADQNVPYDDRAVHYPLTTNITFRCLNAHFTPEPQKFLQMSVTDRSRHELAPRSVFLYSPDAFLSISDGEFKAQYFDMNIRDGEKKVFHIVVGFSSGEEARFMAENILRQAGDGQFGAFEAQWKEALPDFSHVPNRTMRREMFMNAHSLESSAVYDEYFGETFIPCESGEVFQFGKNFSNRDHLQMALPLCYSNPGLAKSILRYVMKHSDFDGRIYGGNIGYGFVPTAYIAGFHDLQIHFFHTLSEYLRITEDYGFLDEKVTLYSGQTVGVMSLLEKYFIHLRDEIIQEAELEEIVRDCELVSSYFPSFISEMKGCGKAHEGFINSLEEYTKYAWEVFRIADYDGEEEKDLNEKSTALYNYYRSLE